MYNDSRNPPVYHLDANRVNAKQRDLGVNRLEEWHERGIIFLEYSWVANTEASKNDKNRSLKANSYTWTEPVDHLGDEAQRKRQIAEITFPEESEDEAMRMMSILSIRPGRRVRLSFQMMGSPSDNLGEYLEVEQTLEKLEFACSPLTRPSPK